MKYSELISEEKTRLDPKCWTGKKIGNPKTKVKGGVRVNNCVPAESVAEGADERKQNALWAQITDYEKRAKATKNDIKKNHLMKMADDLRAKLAVNEGEVVPFPKKHRGDISNMHSCPKCGGDTQGGKYQGHEVQVCMPCKQVYLPPNSGIDQQGNKIKEGVAEGFDYTVKDLGNDYAGFPSNYNMKHKFLAKIKPEKRQLYKDKMNNTHDWDSLFALFKVAKARGDIIEQDIAESEQSDLRKLQQQWWVALPAIMKKAGLDYHPVKELSRDYYPTLGWITIPGERFTTFEVEANPTGDSAKLNIHVDVDTSNEFYRTAQPERAAKLNAVAEKIAQALGGTAAEHMTGQRRNHPGVSRITATMTLPTEPAGWQNPSRSYDPRARFLNTPGERARQSRAARSGFPDSYGGDASNYRFEGVAEEYNAEYDDEAGMAHGSLHTLQNAVEGLQQVIDDRDNLPEWCQEKISLAEDYLVTVWDYLQSEKAQGIDPELTEEFDLIESCVNQIADHNGVDPEMIWEDLESLSHDELYVFAVTSQLNEDWQKANKSDRTDGMSRKAVKAYRRANPGSKLQTAVTTKPSKLKKGSKASKRRKSYCSRSKGQMNMHNISCAKTPDKAICKARRRWNC